MLRYLSLLLVLLLLLGTSAAASAKSAHVPVLDGEFVSFHIGYPGQDVALRLRWDLDVVALFSSVDLQGLSHTYAESDHSDVLCLGKECVRVPIYIVGGEPTPLRPESTVALQLSNYHGVLGLAPGSVLRRHYPWLRYTGSELELHTTAPTPSPDAIYPIPGTAGTVAARVGTQHYCAAVDMLNDYTQVPRSAMPSLTAGAVAKLHLYRNCSTAAQCGSGGTVRINLDKEREYVYTSSDARVPTLRLLPDVVLGAAVAGVSDGGIWNASVAIVIGRLMAQDLFSVVLGPDGTLLWLEPLCKHRPRLQQLNYMPLVLPLLLLLLLWQIGLTEDIVTTRQVATVDVAPPPQFGVTLEVGARAYTIAAGALTQPPVPASNPLRATSLLSFRHTGFVWALGWLTALVALVLLLSLAMAFGLGYAFQRTEMRALDMAAVYSAAGMALFSAAAALNVGAQPSTGATFGICVPLIGLWLLALLDQFTLITAVVLLITGAVVCAHLLQLWLAALLSSLWPGVSYGTTEPLRGTAPRPGARLYLFWLLVCSVAAVWSVWWFGFYTVPYVVTSWRPAHPAAYGVGVLAVILVATFAASAYHSMHLLMVKMVGIRASRAQIYSERDGERISIIEERRQVTTTPK